MHMSEGVTLSTAWRHPNSNPGPQKRQARMFPLRHSDNPNKSLVCPAHCMNQDYEDSQPSSASYVVKISAHRQDSDIWPQWLD